MKLSDIDPNEIEIIQEAPKTSTGLRLSDLDSSEIESAGDVSLSESALRGLGQGLTFGFSDEAIAAAKSTPTAVRSLLESLNLVSEDQENLGDVYRQERDLERAKNLAAEEANPKSYMAGDIGGSIATGIVGGGAGLIGKGLLKTGAKELIKEGVKKGGLKGLMALGAAEGAAQGLGRSGADLTQGDVSGTLQDTTTGAVIGAAAPVVVKGAIKGTKGLASGADYLVEKTPLIGDIYSHLKDVGREGSQRIGQTFKEAGQESLEKLENLVNNLKNKALGQESKYLEDIAKAQSGTGKALYQATDEFKDQLQKGLKLVGTEIENQDIQINQALKQNPLILNKVNDTLKASQFNFTPIKESAEEVSKKITRGKALDDIMNRIQSGDYLEVSAQLRELNSLIEAADPYDKTLLIPLKKQIQQNIDEAMGGLEGEAANFYKKRMDLNKDYSLLSDLRDELGASQYDRTGTLQTKFSLAANPTAGAKAGEALDYKEILRKAYQSGDQDLIAATEDALKKAQPFNKFNIQNPELGTMFDETIPEGQNEKLFQRFKESMGAPKEFSSPAKLATTAEEFGQLRQGTKESSQTKDFIEWLRGTYGDQANDVINDLQQRAKSFRTLEDAREIRNKAGQDVSSRIRGIKKTMDELSFNLGKGLKIGSEYIPEINKAQLNRALTAPINYKNAVQEFKNSQNQGDTEQ